MGNEIGSPLEVPETEAQGAQYVPPYLVSLRESGNETMTQYFPEFRSTYTDAESNFDYLQYVWAGLVLMSLLSFGCSIVEDGPKETRNEPPPNIPPPTYRETVKICETEKIAKSKKFAKSGQPVKSLEPLVTNANFSVDTFGVVRAQNWGINSHHLQ